MAPWEATPIRSFDHGGSSREPPPSSATGRAAIPPDPLSVFRVAPLGPPSTPTHDPFGARIGQSTESGWRAPEPTAILPPRLVT